MQKCARSCTNWPIGIADKLIPPSVQKHEPRFLSESEYQRLLRECSHKPRDAAIIELFLQTGMRLSELAKLQLHDADLKTTAIYVSLARTAQRKALPEHAL